MQTTEAAMLTVVTPTDSGDTATPGKLGNYEPVRFNALKHGILSKLVVLAHEDHAEFADLLAALIDEHQPAGMTERHLIEELATIIWRKRRVLLAEGAKINEGLKHAVNSPRSVMAAAAPFQRNLAKPDADLHDLMGESPEELIERQHTTTQDFASLRKAEDILVKGGPDAYAKAKRALMQDARDWWDEYLAEDAYPATADGLAAFIREILTPLFYQMMQEAHHTPAIKAQTLGEGLRAHLLEKLNRYETHLDRKFERTLAMLLKLKEMRGS